MVRIEIVQNEDFTYTVSQEGIASCNDPSLDFGTMKDVRPVVLRLCDAAGAIDDERAEVVSILQQILRNQKCPESVRVAAQVQLGLHQKKPATA